MPAYDISSKQTAAFVSIHVWNVSIQIQHSRVSAVVSFFCSLDQGAIIL